MAERTYLRKPGLLVMKILHVVSTMDPVSGGPTRVLADLVRYQHDVGHALTLCTTDRGNPTSRRINKSAFAPLLNAAELYCFATEVPPLLVSGKMGTWLRKNIRRFDIVHIHGLYRFPPTYAAYQARARSNDRKNTTLPSKATASCNKYLYNNAYAVSGLQEDQV